MDVSFQLYSARNFTPWDQVVGTVAAQGYTQVEGFGGVYDDPAAFRDLLDRHGLSMPSGHFAIDLLETDPAKAFGIAKTLGMSRIYCPYLTADKRPSDSAGWADVGRRLSSIGDRVRGEGHEFGWHNHDFEMVAGADGGVPMQILLDSAPQMDWEADIAWIVRGGADPLDWIARHGGRIKTAHVKDIAPAGENADEDGWADVGHGTMDWSALLAALRGAGCDLFVVEHDNPSDLMRFASRSINAIRVS